MSTPDLEELVVRVRARLIRTRDHLHAALAGRETEILYSWGVYPEDGLTPVLVPPADLPHDWAEARLGFNWRPPGTPRLKRAAEGAPFFVPDSPRGIAYLTAMGAWPLPSADAWRTAYRQAHTETADDPARFATALDHHLRKMGALAPDALPLRMTIAEGFARLAAEVEALAADTAAELLDGLALVPSRLRAAVGAREALVMRWPWPGHSPNPSSNRCACGRHWRAR